MSDGEMFVSPRLEYDFWSPILVDWPSPKRYRRHSRFPHWPGKPHNRQWRKAVARWAKAKWPAATRGDLALIRRKASHKLAAAVFSSRRQDGLGRSEYD